MSTFIPGPIVEDKTNLVILLGPTALMRAAILAASSWLGWPVFPIQVWIRGAFFSVLTKTLPPSSSFFLVLGSSVMVLFLGLGIRPLGPKVLASLASFGINSLVVSSTSNSILPFSI